MSEVPHNPEQDWEGPDFMIELDDGEEFECNIFNTVGLTHNESDKVYDAVIVLDGDYIIWDDDGEPLIDNDGLDENGRLHGTVLFRQQMPEFDETIDFMKGMGYVMLEADKARRFIKDEYDKVFDITEVEEPEAQELTPRQEKLVRFLGYILEKEQLTAEGFTGKGDLFI
jgi:hypothetical protein